MGFISRLARGFGLVFLAAGSAAQAEVMHMPFDCRADGAGVHLQPAPERTYAIVGPHEREIFSACSPNEADTCRSWFVHRFEFDCGGERVAWIDAAAVAARFTDWDAWIEDGRLLMRMNRLWGVARARPFAARRRWMRRHDRDRENAFAGGPDGHGPRVVTVRPGFAPAVGIPLTFSGGAQEVSEVPAQVAQNAPAVADAMAKPLAAPIPELPERAPPKAERLAAASAPPVVAPAPRPVTKATTAQETPSMAAPAKEPPQKTKTTDAVSGASKSPGFTIINAPHASATEATPAKASSAAETSSGGVSSEPIETAAVKTPAEKSVPPPATSSAMPSPDSVPATSTAIPAQAPPPPRTELMQVSPEAAVAAAATTLALAGLVVFGLWRWRRQPFDASPVNRDIGDISLEGGRAGPRLALDSPAREADPPASESPDRQSDDEADADALPVPTTFAEALEVLGASADASTGAIKKIVDGLRQSWHPDLARSDADRARREARVRQINVAWDLVSQSRSAA